MFIILYVYLGAFDIVLQCSQLRNLVQVVPRALSHLKLQ